MTATDPGVRDAVRQLGRALGTLVRAVVGVVGRKRPAATGPADSGPPQEWLDLVAETDPDWLARSAWADRARVTRRPGRRPGGSRPAPRLEPTEETFVSDELPPAAGPRSTSRRAAPRSPRGSLEVEPATDTDVPREAPADRPVGRQPRRLVPVEPTVATSEEDDPPLLVRRTAPPREAVHVPLSDALSHDAPAAPDRHDANPAARPILNDPSAPRVAIPHLDAPSPYSPLSAPEREETVRRERDRPRHTSPAGPLVHERRVAPRTQPWSQPPRQSPPPSATPAMSWPELPRTDDLDDTAAGPGLAALIWRTDGAPDPLTTAQRRS